MTAATGSLAAAVVATTIESDVPGSTAGQRNFTWVGETESVATASPLTFTDVPPSVVVLPEKSASPSSASHLPRIVPTAPGLQASALVTTGAPEPTLMAT